MSDLFHLAQVHMCRVTAIKKYNKSYIVIDWKNYICND